jgi:hypothetical protein
MVSTRKPEDQQLDNGQAIYDRIDEIDIKDIIDKFLSQTFKDYKMRVKLKHSMSLEDRTKWCMHHKINSDRTIYYLEKDIALHNPQYHNLQQFINRIKKVRTVCGTNYYQSLYGTQYFERPVRTIISRRRGHGNLMHN